jgi:hypothetical protein
VTKKLFLGKRPGKSGIDLIGIVDFTDFVPDPQLEDEYFGNFGKSDDEPEREKPTRPGDVPGCDKKWIEGWGWGCIPRAYPGDGTRYENGRRVAAPASVWGRVWRNRPTPKRYFLGKSQQYWASVGSRPIRRVEDWPDAKLGWYEAKRITLPRAWAAEKLDLPEYIKQALRAAEQKLPVVNPERDRADELDWLARRRERLASLGITDPNDRPFTPQNILHEERACFYAQHTERRFQALKLRGYKPSKALELKRFPVLKRVKPNPLLTRDYLDRMPAHVKGAWRAECELLMAQFLARTTCPAEMLAARATPPKRGRPPIYGRAMTNAEYVRRHRAKLKTPAPHGRNETGVVRPLPLGSAAPVDLLPPSANR